MEHDRFGDYEEFFAFYLQQHRHPGNRKLHAAGTVLGLITAVLALALGRPWYCLLWPVIAYAFAWAGHFVVEGNRPATFGHPFWSLVSDFRMVGLMFTGRLAERPAHKPTSAPR